MRTIRCLLICAIPALSTHAAELKFKDAFLTELAARVPEILKTYNPDTGRFGSGIWIVNDQQPMLPLAVLYATPGNPHFRSEALLPVIIKAGDALIADADENGQWVFRKKDGSTWGKIWMPWIYSRWVRSYALIREDMPPEARERWTRALTLGYTRIAGSQLQRVHNIPAHHAMGLYAAGKALNRPEWCRQAGEFLLKVASDQAEGGYWSEGEGPVVGYNFVYIDALGNYCALSGDIRVLPALEKAAAFHLHFTYPGGQNVETIDQRNPFGEGAHSGNSGFTFNPAGRLWLQQQWQRAGVSKLSSDALSLFILHGREGPAAQPTTRGAKDLFVLTEGGRDRAATLRHGPWFVCLSGYTSPVMQSRWIQDRQNLVSIWHDGVGLILGGGNTHLQPAWSTFTVGDMNLLRHTPGDESPVFRPTGELYHIPDAAKLIRTPDPGLDLQYGPQTCRVRVRVISDRSLEYRIEAPAAGALPTAAHLPLIADPAKPLMTGRGTKLKLTAKRIELDPEQLGGSIAHTGWTLRLPPDASLHWPALPHNPYRKDGRAEIAEGRIEVRIPLARERPAGVVLVEIGNE